jgi:hypothetical protein
MSHSDLVQRLGVKARVAKAWPRALIDWPFSVPRRFVTNQWNTTQTSTNVKYEGAWKLPGRVFTVQHGRINRTDRRFALSFLQRAHAALKTAAATENT